MKWNDLENKTRVRIIQLSVVALFVIAAIPFIIGTAIGLENISPGFANFIWMWPVGLLIAGFAVTVGYIIYESVKGR